VRVTEVVQSDALREARSCQGGLERALCDRSLMHRLSVDPTKHKVGKPPLQHALAVRPMVLSFQR
jgi:hypothetical protein